MCNYDKSELLELIIILLLRSDKSFALDQTHFILIAQA